MLVHVMVNHLVVLAHVASDMQRTRQLALVEQGGVDQLGSQEQMRHDHLVRMASRASHNQNHISRCEQFHIFI
jgi:hypothetical protein